MGAECTLLLRCQHGGCGTEIPRHKGAVLQNAIRTPLLFVNLIRVYYQVMFHSLLFHIMLYIQML